MATPVKYFEFCVFTVVIKSFALHSVVGADVMSLKPNDSVTVNVRPF
jgi:hypothetical protein